MMTTVEAKRASIDDEHMMVEKNITRDIVCDIEHIWKIPITRRCRHAAFIVPRTPT